MPFKYRSFDGDDVCDDAHDRFCDGTSWSDDGVVSFFLENFGSAPPGALLAAWRHSTRSYDATVAALGKDARYPVHRHTLMSAAEVVASAYGGDYGSILSEMLIYYRH